MKRIVFALTATFTFLMPLNQVAAQVASAASGDWRKVVKLAPGTPVVIDLDAVSTLSRMVIRADDNHLYALNLLGAKLTVTDLASLVTALVIYVPGESGVRRYEAVTEDRARVAADGIWMAGHRLGDAAQMIQVIDRSAIVEIRTPRHLVGSKTAAAIGAGGGLAIGFLISTAVASSDRPCGRCASELLVFYTAPIAIPIGLGWLGYHSKTQRVSEVIYRRP